MRSDPRLLLVGVVCAVVGLLGQPARGGNRPEHLDKPYVVLVSLDGFRPDYLDRFALPHLRRVMQRGTRARWMLPVFPTLTFPNHYSLVTGLHPGRHGIVGNSFYDPARRQKYSMSDPHAVTDGSWYGGEPIWVTAERQGMVAACYFWPGSEAAIGGVQPTFFKRYDGTVPNRDRVRGVLDWLTLPPDRRPHLLTLYFSELDSASHAGPLDDPSVERAAQSLDRAVGQLLDGIDALPIKDRIYLLITSDHGMVDTSLKQSITIESLASLDGVVHTFDGPVTSLHVANGDLTRATALRNQVNGRLRHGRAYLRKDLPDRLHYKDNPRAGDVVVIMDEGWTLRRRYDPRPLVRRRWATHGWDNDVPSMRAAFLALGPRVRKGATVEDVHNVDVYPLMAEWLGLRPADGIQGRRGHLARLIME